MNAEMKATWRKMVGMAFLWVALSAVVFAVSSDAGKPGVAVAVLGFFAFCSGLALFTDGMKREIAAEIRRKNARCDSNAVRG